MCGVAGIIGRGARSPELLRTIAASIAHRGPDDEGVWADEEVGVALVHRRLSIVDLSPMGHQPMASNDGRFMIAFNGEIYNHRAIRAELETLGQRDWRGHSDTETLVAAIATWGLRATLARAVGMFAIALWDRRERRLSLARDRFGEKPLYYGWVGGDFAFASELKAIRRHPRFANPVDRRALRLFAARSVIPAPFSIYEGLFKVQPGCVLSVTPEIVHHPAIDPPTTETRDGPLQIERYWSARDGVLAGLADPFRSTSEALDALEEAIVRSIEGQAVADVPVGAFLSGGIDSSTVVGLYQAHAPGTVRSFTIGFEDPAYDEAPIARQVATHFGTYHHEHRVSVADAQAVIPLLPTIYDEPFADSSQIPTFLVSRFARERVTVALSGDGGDELFGGYNRYLAAACLWDRAEPLPRPVRAALGGLAASVPPSAWNALITMAPGGRRSSHYGASIQKLARSASGAEDLGDFFNRFLDQWSAEGSPVLPFGAPPSEASFDLSLPDVTPTATRMMLADATAYLPDDILCKVDRAAMAVGLETRVPFLDHRVAAVAARIPVAMQIRGGTGKRMLRQLLARHAPPALLDRPKAGFAIPVGEWIKGPLRDWAEALIDPARLRREGWFDAEKVTRRWHAHISGRTDATTALWTILMFQSWLDADQAHR